MSTLPTPTHDFANGANCYDQGPIVWVSDEDCLHDTTDPAGDHNRAELHEVWSQGENWGCVECGAGSYPARTASTEEIVRWLEVQPQSDAYLMDINQGYPASETLAMYLEDCLPREFYVAWRDGGAK